jgi:DNA-binding LacI/PurR family transcriptional regulator
VAGIEEVARRAGVTVGIVSRVLNGDPTLRVRPETRERIHAAARDISYTPNHAARALRRSRVGAIGLAVHDVTNPVYAAIISGAQRAASANRVVLMLADVPELADDSVAFSRVVRSGLIDGLLLLPAGDETDDRLVEMASEVMPTVVVNESSERHGSATIDNEAAMRLATQHLLDLGHREIALLELDGGTVRANDRTLGFRRAMADAGVEVRPEWVIEGGHTVAAGEAAAEVLLAMDPRPRAVAVANVMAAMGVIGAARRHGVEVPSDLSVIGFNDLHFAELLNPGLTVVAPPLRELGEAAVALLTKQIDCGEIEHVVVREPASKVIVRASTAPA